MATRIPPHNLTEVVNGAIALIEDPEIVKDRIRKALAELGASRETGASSRETQ